MRTLFVMTLFWSSALAQPEALHPALSFAEFVEAPSGAFRLVSHPAQPLLYLLTADGRVLRLEPATGELTELYGAEDHGLVEVAGLAVSAQGNVFVSGNRTVDTTHNVGTVVRLNDAVAVVAETEPYPLKEGAVFNHKFNALELSPDGAWLYVNSGSRTDHGEVRDFRGVFPGAREVPLTSVVLKLPADATDLVLPASGDALEASGYVFARGLRNAYDLAFSAQGELFGVDNSGDRDDPDELNWLGQGRHYGFPWRMGLNDNPTRFAGYEPGRDPLLPPSYTAVQEGAFYYDASFPPPPALFTDPVLNLGPDADLYRSPLTGEVLDGSETGEPVATFSPHRSPLGLVFDTSGALPAPFARGGFVLSWNPGAETGGTALGESQDLLHLELERQGENYQARVTRVARGFRLPVDAALVGSTMYVLEYGGGKIWRLTFAGD